MPKNKFVSDGAQKIRSLRRFHRLSQRAVARPMGHPQSWLQAVESGKIRCSVKHFDRIAETVSRLVQSRVIANAAKAAADSALFRDLTT